MQVVASAESIANLNSLKEEHFRRVVELAAHLNERAGEDGTAEGAVFLPREEMDAGEDGSDSV